MAGLYSSAAGETPWAATLADFANHFRSSASVLQLVDTTLKSLASEVHGYSRQDADAYYASGAFARDPRIARIYGVPPGTIYYDHMLYDVAEMERDPRVRETIDVLKVKYQLGAILRLPDAATAGFAILSTPEEGHASASAIRAFHRLAPHIEQACTLGQIVEEKTLTRTALLEALADKAEGVILLDDAGLPVFVNDAAAQVLSAGDGLQYAAGVFAARRPPETRRLQKLVADAISVSLGSDESPGGRMLVSRPSGKRPYVLRVVPAPRIERFLARSTIACMIHLQDLARIDVPSRESLALVFGLTQREADFAIELARCTGLDGAAENAGMALNTARNHLQSVFRKTGTASQAQLVQLLGRLT